MNEKEEDGMRRIVGGGGMGIWDRRLEVYFFLKKEAGYGYSLSFGGLKNGLRDGVKNSVK